MNIFHQLRSGGDKDFADVYAEVPWLEFKERPDQDDEELIKRWAAMPADVPRGFKSHASPGPHMDFHPNVKYVVVMRNPEEAICSFYPFLSNHNPELFKVCVLWTKLPYISESPPFPVGILVVFAQRKHLPQAVGDARRSARWHDKAARLPLLLRQHRYDLHWRAP